LSITSAVVPRLDVADRLARRHRHDLDQVRDAGLLLRVVPHLAARVGYRALELLPDHVRRIDHADDSLRRAARRRHQALRFLQVLDPRAGLGIHRLRDHERLAVALVEPLGDVPRELEVLPLVVPDRNDVGLVQQDVARHEHGVREQAGGDEVLLLRLLLELCHPAQLAEGGHRAEQPGGLGVRGHLALREHRRAVGIEAGREQHRRQRQRVRTELIGLVGRRDRVEVDDAEERVALLLRRDVLAEAARVVAEGLVS